LNFDVREKLVAKVKALEFEGWRRIARIHERDWIDVVDSARIESVTPFLFNVLRSRSG
jgi:hypothetical protein